jgi:hypothetical protein
MNALIAYTGDFSRKVEVEGITAVPGSLPAVQRPVAHIYGSRNTIAKLNVKDASQRTQQCLT